MTRATYTVREHNGPAGGYEIATPHHVFPDYFDTREDALDSLFSPSSHGYAIAWYGDGFILCTACARQTFEESEEWAPHSDPFTLQRELMDGDTHAGEYCDCGAVIVEPHCVDCGDDVADHPERIWFYDDSEGKPICSTCLANEVVKGNTRKTGRLAYRVWPYENSQAWYGGATYIAR